jgi:outer membrane protein
VASHRRPHPRLISLIVAALLAVAPAPGRAQTLVELYRAALQGNPALLSRQFDVERARGEADGAYSRLLPQVMAQGGWSRNEFRDRTNDLTYSGKRASLIARLALYDPAARGRYEASQSIVAQRDEDLAQTRLELFGELLDRYLQALAAQDKQAALVAEAQAARQHVDRLRAMRERQMAKVTDLAEAQAYVQGLATRAIDADNERAVALLRLGELSGIAVRQVPALTRTSFEPVTGSPVEQVAEALRSNRRVAALTRAVEATRRNVEAIRAERRPQIAATLSRTHADQGFDNRQQPPYHATSLGLEWRVPLYEGGRVDAAEREAMARVGAVEQQLEAVRREIAREIETLLLSGQANHARIGSTDLEVSALEQAVQAQERGLELGVSRITDLLDARRRLLEARADQSKARYDYVRDVAAMRIRNGALSEADVERWSGWFGSTDR